MQLKKAYLTMAFVAVTIIALLYGIPQKGDSVAYYSDAGCRFAD